MTKLFKTNNDSKNKINTQLTSFLKVQAHFPRKVPLESTLVLPSCRLSESTNKSFSSLRRTDIRYV